MTRLSTIAALAVASAVLTPFVVEAAGQLGASERTQAAPVAAAPARVEAPAQAPEAVCARKIKVVYGGYGEAAGCAPAAADRL